MSASVLLISVVVIGFIATITLGSQAYFRGEVTKPIHERNWNSSAFDALAETVTGEKVDQFNRQPGFEVGDAYTSTVIAQQ